MDYIEQRMLERVAQMEGVDQTFLTPLNLILLSLLCYTLYSTIAPPIYATYPLPPTPPPTLFKTFTPVTLLPYNGTNNMPVYLAVRGRVFDVTSGKGFYGPGGAYENFAGRDASRGLALHSFDEAVLTKDLEAELDLLDNAEGTDNKLGDEEMESLRGWEERFEGKYGVVGRLVSVGDYKRLEKEGKV